MAVKNLLVKVLLSVFAMEGVAHAEAPKYPAIREWQGSVWLTGKDGKRQVLKSKQVLREKATLQTGMGALVKVQLDEKRYVTLLGDAEVSFPVISWESGEAPVILLKSGSLHWEQDLDQKAAYNVAVRSDLFEFLAPPGDYILAIHPAKAFASVKMLNGSMEFSALNGEESVSVKSGQQAGFQGVIESGEIAYDVLLKGKKIPKGQLTAAEPLDAKELALAAEAEKKRQLVIARKKAKVLATADEAKRAGVICVKPAGKLNECVWTCVNNPKGQRICAVSAGATCERQRCNANGDWAEKTTLDAEKASSVCKAQPVVAPCDY